jgi:uncharacterized protein YecE (DUF72 family)
LRLITMDKVKVGCCGFPRGMKHYFSQFRLVEVQQTFYKPPQIETAVKWRQAAPTDFEFTIKAWQLITHPPSSPTYRKAGWHIPPGKEKSYGCFKPSDEVMEAWQKTKEIAQAVRARIILFQCPASFVASGGNIDHMRQFFRSLGKDEFLFAWEPRGDWSQKVIASLCQELNLIHCVDPLEMTPLYGAINYLRLHGSPDYRHRYSDEELEQLRHEIGDKESYILFNNIAMYDDSLRFIKLVEGEPG